MNLSKHVTLAEFENSPTATTHGINNKMNESQIASAKLLCENVFEPLRLYLNIPIKISSGFRSVQLNKMIKGSLTSQHTKGEAMDIKIDAKGFYFIKDKLEFDQLIWEFGNDEQPSWVHVSYKKSGNRKQVLKATKRNGKTIYSSY
jgi:zinc D-Ala-D-Ala carboxypeptidase